MGRGRRRRGTGQDGGAEGGTASSSMKVIVNGRGAELRNGAHRGIGENGWRVENGRAFRHADVVGERQRERERQRACASFDPPQLRSADGG